MHRITRLPITPSPSPNTNALLLTRVMISSDIVSYSILIRVFFPFYIHIYMKINHIHTRLGDDKANMLYGRLPRTAERTKLEKCALVSISCFFSWFECWSTINTRFVAIYSNAGRMRIEKECYMLALTLNFRLIVIHNTKGAICWIFKSHCHAKEHAICIFSLRENARYLRWLAKLTVSFRSQFNMWYKFS